MKKHIILCVVLLVAGCSPASDTIRARMQAALPLFEAQSPPDASTDARAKEVRQQLAQAQWDAAQATLESWWGQDSDGEAAFLLGWLHHQQKRYALALPWVERALDAGPTYPKAGQVFFLLGRCLQETGDLQGAREAYTADGVLFPDGGDSPFRLALLDFEEGRLDDCEGRLTAALERFSAPRDKAKVLAHRADLHLARDDPAAARLSLEQCVSLFPHYEAFYKLSQICARLGDEAAASAARELHLLWRERARGGEDN